MSVLDKYVTSTLKIFIQDWQSYASPLEMSLSLEEKYSLSIMLTMPNMDCVLLVLLTACGSSGIYLFQEWFQCVSEHCVV